MAKELAKGLESNATLTTLDCNHNGIGAAGCATLFESVKGNPNIQVLGLEVDAQWATNLKP
eukprot:510101-Prymnesium_polylepis.1